MHLLVLTPDQEIFSGEIERVKVPGEKGQFEVLKNHAPIVSSLSAGFVTWLTDKGEKVKYHIDQGFVEVLNNRVSLLVRGARKSS